MFTIIIVTTYYLIQNNYHIMKIKLNLIILLSGLLWVSSCHPCEPDSQVTEVKYGTYFGECWGYCAHDLDLKEGVSDSYHHWYGGAPDRMCSEPYDHWQSLTESIDFGEFKQLDETIGCPDCADGGAEWIEITNDGETYRVTFEFMNEPNTVSAYIDELRAQMEIMKEVCL